MALTLLVDNALAKLLLSEAQTATPRVQAAAPLYYFFCLYFTKNFIINFVVTTVLIVVEFWYTKNIVGRRLTGMRWWQVPSPDSTKTTWRFEHRTLEQVRALPPARLNAPGPLFSKNWFHKERNTRSTRSNPPTGPVDATPPRAARVQAQPARGTPVLGRNVRPRRLLDRHGRV